MKHKINALVISFLVASPAFAESYAFEQDKQKHFAGGGALAGLTTIITKDPAVGIGVAATAGILKELYDRKHGGRFSTADVVWTAAGGVAGAYVGGLIITPLSVSYSWDF